MIETPWEIRLGQMPLVITAIHNGHELFPGTQQLYKVTEEERLRHEAPFSDKFSDFSLFHEWTPYSVTVNVSRFAVDLNRPREACVYTHPDESWGLQIWQNEPSEELLENARTLYDRFYSDVESLLSKIVARFGGFAMLDIYSYNHRTGGPDATPENPQWNPDINVGTGTLDRLYWADLVERLLTDLRGTDYFGRRPDVRENVKFKGGRFPLWVNSTFPSKGISLPIEIKKIFFDEWTGELNAEAFDHLKRIVKSSVFGLLGELAKKGEAKP